MKYDYKKWILLILSTSFLSACGSTGKLVGPSGTFEKQSNSVLDNESQIVFFREDVSADTDDALLVSSNERLLGSVVKDEFLPAKICPGEHILKFETTGKNANTQNVEITTLNGSTTYMGVSVTKNGIINVKQFSDESALDLLQDDDYQSYLVNRNVVNCPPIDVPIKLKDIELSADALFDFDGATLTDLVAKDKLNNLVEQIESSQLNITNIVVVGHTDRLGKKDYNQKLSERRAKTVANYLLSNGIKGDIKSMGFGSAQPVTKTCLDSLPRNKLIECLQPDRRVNVELWGTYEVSDESLN